MEEKGRAGSPLRRKYYWMGSVLPLLKAVWVSPTALTATLRTTSLPVGASDGTWKVISKTPIRLGETREVMTRVPLLLTPTITWPRASESAPGTGTAPVTIGGLVAPRPVAKTRTLSPRRAGFCRLTKVPSGRTTTARRAPSLITVSKMPGLAATTGNVMVPVPPATLMVMGTLLAGAVSQGAWKVSCAAPATLPTLKMGAATLATVTVSDARLVAQGPKEVKLKTMPWTLGARPEANTVTRPHGERATIRASPPALKKLSEERAGPGGMTVSVKYCEKVWMAALTVTGPGVVPAVTVTRAWPVASVRAESVESTAAPLVTAKPMGWFARG